MGEKLVAQNRRARHDYQILETFEAGMELRGTEVKSLRNGKLTLKDSFVDIRGGDLYLVNAHIPPYEQAKHFNHEAERPRRLLMHRKEIDRLSAKVAEKGLTMIPLKVYFKRGRAKLELGLCRGKHTADKRDTIKEREAKREIDRALRDREKSGA